MQKFLSRNFILLADFDELPGFWWTPSSTHVRTCTGRR